MMSDSSRDASSDGSLNEGKFPSSSSDLTDADSRKNNPLSKVIDMLSRVLSQERLKLPIGVRSAVEEEIHGVRCRALEETPELIHTSLVQFRMELDAVSNSTRDIYDRIVSRVAERPLPEKHYATEDEEFRMRFLRCELFDAKKAVVRFLSYLNLVNELWGFEIVSRRLVIKEDFTKGEIKHLRKGYIQLLPFRDRSGRRLVVYTDDPSDSDEVSHNTMMKCFLYVLDIASRNSVESQQKGVVWLTDPRGMDFRIQKRIFAVDKFALGKFTHAIPTRIVAGHHYVPNSMAYRLLGKYLWALHSSGSISPRLVRHKFYVGYTQMEMKYHLLGFGIPVQYIPWTETGTIKTKYWKGLLKSRAMIEAGQGEEIVECPSANDVVFRHGQSYKQFHGNDTLREWIETELVCRKMAASSLDSQNKSEQFHKNTPIDQFCDHLIHEIEINQKGRFLKWDNEASAWVRMQDQVEIKKKLSASFYNYAVRNCDKLFQELSNSSNHDDPYRFIEGGKRTTPTDLCLVFNVSKTNARKKPKMSG